MTDQSGKKLTALQMSRFNIAGAAYAVSEEAVRDLINSCELPFLATPMGKGVVPDSSPFCVASARTEALKNADVIVLLGARLNWILHFGRPPRFHPGVVFIQVPLIISY